GVLGLIVILTAGTFGTINSSPWFNLTIAAIFVVLALAMFDVLVIDFSSLGSRFRVNEEGRGSLVVAFTMGGIAALLAGACVAPVVVQVVLFSSNLYATGASAAVRTRSGHGDSVAARRRGHFCAAAARCVDGSDQAGVRRRHPRDRGVLRLGIVRAFREPVGQSV